MNHRVFALLLLPATAHAGGDKPARPAHTSTATALQARRFVGNRIGSFVSNRGMIGRDPVTGNAGFEYPRGSGKYAIYDAGIWLGGYVGGQLRMVNAEYSYDFRGGPYGEADEAAWPVLRLTRLGLTRLLDTDTANDGSVPADERADFVRWLAYPGSPRRIDSTRGGPFFGREVPRVLGDETLYTIYHDGGPGGATGDDRLVTTRPFDLEVHQTVFGVDQPGAPTRTMFVRYQIFNRGTQPIDSTRLGLWMDPDLGAANDDLAGFDVPRSLAYVYNGAPTDDVYGTNVPAVGWTVLQGPLTAAGPEETGTAFGQSRSGFRNVPATAGYIHVNGGATILPLPEAQPLYFELSGLTEDGAPVERAYPDSRFASFGDPVTGTPPLDGSGDNVNESRRFPGDRRMLMGVGPFTLAAGDSQDVVTAFAVGDQRGDRISNISDLRWVVENAYAAYVSGFLETDPTLAVTAEPVRPMRFRLFPAAPNPFNPSTELTYVLPTDGPVQLTVYDLLGRRIRTLVDAPQTAGEHQLRFDGSGLTSGVYLVQLVAREFSQTQRLTLLR